MELRGQTNGQDLSIAEVVKTVWELRKFIVIGFGVGIIVSIIGWASFVVQWYTTTISVNIDPASLPAATETQRVSVMFPSMLSSPEYAYGIFDSIHKVAPVFAENLKKTNFNLGSLANSQVSSDDPDSRLLRIQPTLSANDFLMIVKLPANGLGKDAADIIVSAFNAQIKQHNARIERDHLTGIRSVITDSQQKYIEAANRVQSEGLSLHEKRIKLRERAATAEYRLFRKLMQGSSAGLKFAESVGKETHDSGEVPPSVCIQNFEGKTCPPKIAKTDGELDIGMTRSLRMLAALNEEKKLSDGETRAALDELIKIQLEQSRTNADLSRFNRPAESSLQTLLAATEQENTAIDRVTRFLPTFVINRQIAESAQLSGLEVARSRRYLLVIISGGLLGSIVAAAFGFVRRQLQLSPFSFK